MRTIRNRNRRAEIGRARGLASQVVQREQRRTRAPDADTVRQRARNDARGTILRVGVLYHGDGRAVDWSVARTVAGRWRQLDLVHGAAHMTAGPRTIARRLHMPERTRFEPAGNPLSE